jgi:ATP-dependent DNA helicase HFM1/MER3
MSGAPLFAVADIPEFVPFFKSFDHFNPIQTALLPSLLSEDERNIVCTAPTASGKTVLLEIALLKFFLPHPTGRKAIYVAPLKSLVSEKFEQWSAQFPQLRICEVTGDSADTDALGIRNLTTYDLLLTTPEKLDSIMRRWREHHSLTDHIGLLLVDEIHCLGEARGGTLEGLISRCKAMRELQRAQLSRLPIASLRIVAVSATFANAADLGEWLDADCSIFGDEYRPVPITTMVVGYPYVQPCFPHPFPAQVSISRTLDIHVDLFLVAGRARMTLSSSKI